MISESFLCQKRIDRDVLGIEPVFQIRNRRIRNFLAFLDPYTNS
jgi:hypothetical protein